MLYRSANNNFVILYFEKLY